MPSALERKRIDHELRKLGFGGLNDPNLVQQIAFCIRDHEQFRRQLFSVVPEKRKMAYEQLRPHLRFQAKPLDVYEAEMKQYAEQAQLPTLRQGEVYPTPFKVPEVGYRVQVQEDKHIERVNEKLAEEYTPRTEHCLTLTCAHCLKEEQFYSWSRILADVKASSAGWKSEGDKSWCPEHAPQPVLQ